MQRLQSRLRYLIDHDTAPVETFGGWLPMAAIAVWLLLPSETLTSGLRYRHLSILPEVFWATAAAAIATSQLVCLLGGARIGRRVSAFVCSAAWFGLSWSLYSSNPPVLAVPLFATLWVSQTWVYARGPR